MKKNVEQYWQAHLDGELSASEAADFEASLTDAQREQLVIDMRVERVLTEHLSRDADCPDEVWERTKARVAQLDKAKVREVAGRRHWYWGTATTLAAAAAFAFVISLLAPTGGSPDSSSLIFAASTVEELVATSESQAGSDSVEHYIREKGIKLYLEDDSFLEKLKIGGGHHQLRIIGARQEMHNGVPVTEVLIDCCGRPVKILLVSLDSDVAGEISLATTQEGHIQATRVIGNYLAALVCRHESYGLLDLLSE